MFEPPRCPNRACAFHLNPKPRFYHRWGHYWPDCRRFPVPRFRCKSCLRTFSRQTFRGDYRDLRPEVNARLFELISSGVGLRQCARNRGLSVRGVQKKAIKLGRLLAGLHDNLAATLPPGRTYALDEEETYEGASIRTLTVPLMVDVDSWFLVGSAVGPIRRLARRGSRRRELQDDHERRHGRRPDHSRACVQQVLRGLERRLPRGSLCLRTDQKSSYRTLIREVFGTRARHEVTSSRQERNSFNPLFPINVTIAMSRDGCGRLRRQSWLAAKKASGLRVQLQIYTAYRNYVRVRFNTDERQRAPACYMGLLPRALSWEEAVRWRQDWGPRSISPLSRSGRRTVETLVSSAA